LEIGNLEFESDLKFEISNLKSQWSPAAGGGPPQESFIVAARLSDGFQDFRALELLI